MGVVLILFGIAAIIGGVIGKDFTKQMSSHCTNSGRRARNGQDGLSLSRAGLGLIGLGIKMLISNS